MSFMNTYVSVWFKLPAVLNIVHIVYSQILCFFSFPIARVLVVLVMPHHFVSFLSVWVWPHALLFESSIAAVAQDCSLSCLTLYKPCHFGQCYSFYSWGKCLWKMHKENVTVEDSKLHSISSVNFKMTLTELCQSLWGNPWHYIGGLRH